jgi:Protein of unknown function (DUF2634).
MSFPFDTEEVNTVDTNTTLLEYAVNFDKGRLTGDIVEGQEALKIWIYLALKCTRYRYVIYSWDYGNELESLIGNSFSREYLEAECKDMVENCLLVNEKIKSIDNFEITLDNDQLKLSFIANTIFGEVEINV